MANEFSTIGMLVQVGDGASPEVFTTIGGVTATDGIGGASADDLEVTALEDKTKRYIKGLTDEGEVSLSINTQAGNVLQQQLADDSAAVANVDRNYQILKEDGTTVFCSFNAYAKGYSGSLSLASVVTASCHLKLNTKPVWVI